MTALHIMPFNFRNWITYKLEARRLRQIQKAINRPLSLGERQTLILFRELRWMHHDERMVAVSYELEDAGEFDKLRWMAKTHQYPQD